MSSRRPDLRSDLQRAWTILDKAPDRAVIIDSNGDAWQKSGYLGDWYRAFDGDGISPFFLAQRGPVELLPATATEADS